MSDYAKKKNDELAALCKERNLPHTGKKADLVKRLEEYDVQAASSAAAPVAANEDEIDWDEEAATNAPAAQKPEAVAAPAPTQVENTTEATKDVTNATTSTAQETTAAPSKDFTAGIPEVSMDTEIEKRLARARRFGGTGNDEQIKLLERAKRFGGSEGTGFLNRALPTDRERKRGAPDTSGGIRKKSKGGQGPGKPQEKKPERKPEQAQAKPKPNDAKARESKSGYPAWMTAEDREKAEKRKAKFSSTT